MNNTENYGFKNGLEIAIIGMAGRFPGAKTIEEFWHNLREGIDSISFFSDEELESSGVDPNLLEDPSYVKAGGVLKDIEFFDASFFGFHPKEAELIDPQHRLFLECAWEALENAGYNPQVYEGSIGVYAGARLSSYLLLNILANHPVLDFESLSQNLLGNEQAYLTTRVSYKLNLKGPSYAVATACSTSLTAVHLACQSLLNGECDMALAGGVGISSPQKSGYLYQEEDIFSADGRCRAFDAKAQGTVMGNGLGIVILKRLEDALADRDSIHAVIKGSAINNDGAFKVSYTAPSIEGQAKAIRAAQAIAEIESDTITYIEAHGTGTPLGDPIEIAALTQAFRASTHKKSFCAIGSVKTNIGHLGVAAGVAGLIKTILALKHKQIPPTLHCEQPNPQIDFANSPFYVNTKLSEWRANGVPRRAGVSSFGMGGTNAHVILEEAPPATASEPSRSWQLLLLSAKTSSALETVSANLTEYLQQHPQLNLADVAHTLQVGRQSFNHRRMLVCQNLDDAVKALKPVNPQRVFTHFQEPRNRAVVFVFPGQGTQYVNMGKELYQTELVFREQVEYCCRLLKSHLNLDLRNVLYPNEEQAEAAAQRLKETRITQPALFVIEYALAQLWIAWGVRPQAMMGHSIGEYVAACIAGVFSLEEALALVAIRGQLMQQLPVGAMVAIPLSELELKPLLSEKLSLAAINGPNLCVVSGPTEVVDDLHNRLTKQDVDVRRLHTSHAFHSQMMDPIVKPFMAQVRKVTLKAPQIPFVSNVTGTWITNAEATDPGYWARHLRQTVRFADGMAELLQHSEQILLEVGPGWSLNTLCKQHSVESVETVVLSSLPHAKNQQSDVAFLLNTLGRLWSVGVPVNWSGFYSHERRYRVPLPAYPFEREKYWIESPSTKADQSRYNDELQASLKDKKKYIPSANSEEIDAQNCSFVQSTEKSTEATNANEEQDAADATLKEIMSFLKESLSTGLGINLDKIDVHQDLLSLGVESLFLIQFSNSIKNKFGIKIPFRLFLEELPTLHDLATHIARQMPPEEQVNRLSLHSLEPASLVQEELSSQQVSAKVPEPQLLNEEDKKPVPSSRSVKDSDEKRSIQSKAGSTSGDREGLNPHQREYLDSLIARVVKRTQESKRLTQDARTFLANPRAVTGFRPSIKEVLYPIHAQRGSGSRIWDVDGNEYIDISMGFGTLLFGHSPSFVIEAIQDHVQRGIQHGPQSPLTGKVAELICELTGQERATFCNSGTEAVMGAIRVARATTGRSKIAFFAGSYHGALDEVLVMGGGTEDGKLRSFAIAPGIPQHKAEQVMVLNYGNPESLNILKAHAHELAAVLVEPVQSRHPDLQPKEFLHELRKLTQATGVVLVFDEVITGFRMHPGGMQALWNIQADITTYGKAVGAGLPIGILAGKAAFMDALDGGFWSYGDASYPQAETTIFAGTFFKHPLVMAAAWAALKHIKDTGPKLQEQLAGKTTKLADTLNIFFEQKQLPIQIVHFGSLFCFTYSPDLVWMNLLFYHLLEKGVYVWEGRTCFLSTAHSNEDIEQVIEAVKESVVEMQSAGFLPPEPVLTTDLY